MALSCRRVVLYWFFHIMAVVLVWVEHSSATGVNTFGFDMHHRYSDTVKKILNIDGLPKKDTVEYYNTMVQHDHRRLAAKVDSALTFAAGNQTARIPELASLHYAEISVGTPRSTFLVALGTGTDFSWIPCDCTSCKRSFVRNGKRQDLNMYSFKTSTTSRVIPYNSSKCLSGQFLRGTDSCYYDMTYADGSSSRGVIVEDMLHLVTNDDQKNGVDASITFGCGMDITGFLIGAINGVFGLGMGENNQSLPSILASKGLTPDSFSMCFGPSGFGRIVFGDKGISDQGETPFISDKLNPSYYTIQVTRVVVGDGAMNLNFTALFDSGSTVSSLEDPAYTFITSKFNSLIENTRYYFITPFIYEYCYYLRTTSDGHETPKIPKLAFTMKGGNQFIVTMPIKILKDDQGGDLNVFCLMLTKSMNFNVIGQNFMTGYNVVFDRERMVLGWKESNCSYAADNSKSGSNAPYTFPLYSSFSKFMLILFYLFTHSLLVSLW